MAGGGLTRIAVNGLPRQETSRCVSIDRALSLVSVYSDYHSQQPLNLSTGPFGIHNDIDALHDAAIEHPEAMALVGRQAIGVSSKGCGSGASQYLDTDRNAIVECPDDASKRCGVVCIRSILGPQEYNRLNPVPTFEKVMGRFSRRN